MRHNREIYAWEQGVYSSFFRAPAGGVRSARRFHLKTSSPGPTVQGPDRGVAMWSGSTQTQFALEPGARPQVCLILLAAAWRKKRPPEGGLEGCARWENRRLLRRRGRAPSLPRAAERRQSEPAETDEHQRPGGGFGDCSNLTV